MLESLISFVLEFLKVKVVVVRSSFLVLCHSVLRLRRSLARFRIHRSRLPKGVGPFGKREIANRVPISGFPTCECHKLWDLSSCGGIGEGRNRFLGEIGLDKFLGLVNFHGREIMKIS